MILSDVLNFTVPPLRVETGEFAFGPHDFLCPKASVRPPRSMAASQEAKAQDLLVKAEKRLNSWTNFLSGENKYDAAAEMYSKAANLFKVSKNWSEAGKAFEQVAQCHIKLKSAHEAATAYQDAANCYKKVDSSHAVLVYKEAVVRGHTRARAVARLARLGSSCILHRLPSQRRHLLGPPTPPRPVARLPPARPSVQ